MIIIYKLLIFCLVIFFYLHIYFHLKTSDDLEIYEIDQPAKERLEELCDLRQPLVFSFANEDLMNNCQRRAVLDTYGAFDIKIRNSKLENNRGEKYFNINKNENEMDELFVSLPFSSALKTIEEDTEHKYLLEQNTDFLEETGLVKIYKYNDAFLRPPMVASCAYDFLMGSLNTTTPLRYELNYRTFFLVTEGQVKLKLTPPKSIRYLYPIKDYENFEFRSPVNPWQIQAAYKADFNKIKFLEITLKTGQMIFLPAYWWYSFEFSSAASLCAFKYRTYMNICAILPQLGMRLLQSQNVKRNILAPYTDLAAAEPAKGLSVPHLALVPDIINK